MEEKVVEVVELTAEDLDLIGGGITIGNFI